MSATTPRPPVLVRLADPARRDAARAALETRYAVRVEDPGAEAASVSGRACADRARAWVDAGVRAAVLDYVAEDAASVKLLQAATDLEDAPRLVFVLPDAAEMDQGQFLMAMNEGAWAILPAPLDAPTLANYVERALEGPGRFRREPSAPLADDGLGGTLAALEERLRASRERVAACERLIGKMLSTPPSSWARRALIVSDSGFQREQLVKLLQEHGYQVFAAAKAEEAVELTLREKPRIVISDFDIGGDMDGVALCRRLKIEEKCVPCHFVICTANHDRRAQVMTPGNGVDDCLPKPGDSASSLDFIARISMGLLL